MTHRTDAKRHIASGSAATPPKYSAYGASSYGGAAPLSYGGSAGAAGAGGATTFFDTETLEYEHNRLAIVFLVPPLLSVFCAFDSPYPLQTLIFLVLAMYAMDMANARELLSVFLWVSVAILTMVTGWFMLLDTPDDDDGGLATLSIILRTAGNCFLFLCLGSWCTLQFEWINADAPSWAKAVERMLHSLLPPVAAAVTSYYLSTGLEAELGGDLVATLLPLFFAVFLVIGMIFLGCCEASFVTSSSVDNNHNGKSNEKSDERDNGKTGGPHTVTESFILSTRYARVHSTILLLAPALMHIMTFRRRILSPYISMDDILDLVIVWTIPYLLHYLLHTLHVSGKMSGPYSFPTSFINNILFPRSGNTLRGAFMPLVVSLAASLAAQQRYLIPLCHQVSYQFKGHDLPSSQMVSIFLTVATIFVVAGGWIWGSISTQTNEPLFGEFHEDVVQLLFALAGLAGGLAFGMPWGLIPLPILAFLGLSLWLTTRLLRYLSVFLFVVHATGVVLFSYRFAGMDITIQLALPRLSLTLTRFGILITLASIVVGFLGGLAVRSSGGFGAQLLKRFDVAGQLLIAYSVVLALLECTLLTQPLPAKELAGIELDITEVEDEQMLYDESFAYFTSGLIIIIAICMQYNRSISSLSANVAISSAVAKAVTVFIDANDESTSMDDSSDSITVFFRYLSAALLIVVMFMPRAVLKPVHIKSRYKRAQPAPGAGMVESLPRTARPMIVLYCFIMLPACLVVSVPTVIMPFIGACSSYYGGGYYEMSPPLSIILGYILSFWGVASLSMLNHYLPDAGGELFKKFSALTFLMAVGLIFAAPSMPQWMIEGMMMMGAGKSPKSLLQKSFNNPYATLSSLGVQLIIGKKSRSGGWGLVSAIFATLLAISGPLELRERKHSTGRKDTYFLFRLMTFSLMFGCGAAWFIVMQSMSEEKFLVLLLTAVASMAIAFFGTVATVLGYFLELDSFDEAMQVSYVWVASFPLFLGICSIPQFLLKGKIHPFGSGGWASTYLTIYGLTGLTLTLGLRSRKAKSKDTRAAANVSCVSSFVCAISVLYGRFGVAGLDANFDVATILGIPTAILGTFVAAPILLALEGEGSIEGRGNRLKRPPGAAGHKSKSKLFSFMNIKNLNPTTKFVPPLMGSVVVFLYASLYVILVRGSGLLFFEKIAVGHDGVYKTASAAASSSEGSKNKLDDLATLYQKAMVHNKAMFASAKLAGAGFWTSPDMFGPLLHLGGVAACMPSLFLLSRYLWSGGGGSTNSISAAHVTLALPLNSIPIFLCRGIPSLQAAAWVALLGGLMQLFNMRLLDKQSKMRI